MNIPKLQTVPPMPKKLTPPPTRRKNINPEPLTVREMITILQSFDPDTVPTIDGARAVFCIGKEATGAPDIMTETPLRAWIQREAKA